jgi:integrase
MVLIMSRPVKHRKTGIYQFRKRVPDDLRSLVGKREEKASLGTRDAVEAKILHAHKLAEIEERWRMLRAGVLTLNEKQAVAISGEIYRKLIQDHGDNPSAMPRGYLLFDYARYQPTKVKITPLGTDAEGTKAMIEKVIANSEKQMKAFAEEFLTRKGLRLDEKSLKMVLAKIAQAVIQARRQVGRMADGDYSVDPEAGRFPPFELSGQKSCPGPTPDPRYHILEVFEKYAAEKKIAPASYIKWKPIIEKVAAEVPDCRDLTREWVIDWKDRLLTQGLSQIHVKDSYIAALKAVCTWGVANARLSVNPCANVTVSVPRKVVTRGNSFTDQEATKILSATLQPVPMKMSDGMRAARRWVPWLCAYTGARVGEISQLRKQDVQQHDGYWLLWITPEAGSTKDCHPRYVALHQHLIEQGFLEFVKAQKAGALFYDKSLARNADAKRPQHKKVGEKLCKWIRSDEVGVSDIRIQPNHGWRHTFKTKARRARMDVGARDYMQGHAPATEGEHYGEHSADVLAAEIAKLPRFEIVSPLLPSKGSPNKDHDASARR